MRRAPRSRPQRQQGRRKSPCWRCGLVWAALAVLGLFWATGPASGAEPPPRPDPGIARPFDPSRLKPGMSATEVRDMLGSPKHTARQILSGRYLEQWTYDGPTPVRIEFDWRKGEEKQNQSVEPLSAPPRRYFRRPNRPLIRQPRKCGRPTPSGEAPARLFHKFQ